VDYLVDCDNWYEIFEMATTADLYGGTGGEIPEESFPTPADHGKGDDKNRKPGNFRTQDVPVPLIGRVSQACDKRKFKYDVLKGVGAALPFAVTRDDRMSAVEAGNMLEKIHNTFGLTGAPEGVMFAFDQALFVCHTLNSASILMPGRSTFSVPGSTEVFEYQAIRDMCNVDFRRFMRAMADDIADANKRVIDSYDPYNFESVEMYGQLMQVAAERGLHRYPWLAHDSADACVRISLAERGALSASKVLVLSNTYNAADKMNANPRVKPSED